MSEQDEKVEDWPVGQDGYDRWLYLHAIEGWQPVAKETYQAISADGTAVLRHRFVKV